MNSRIVVLAGLLLSLACGERPATGDGEQDITKIRFAPSLGIDLAAMSRTPRGVMIRDLAIGTGDPVGKGSEVAIHYEGHLPDGTPFDANGPLDPPFTFRIESGDVVPGFDEAVTGMRKGGRRLAIIPPALGYGSEANGPIPANSFLVFTIELVGAP